MRHGLFSKFHCHSPQRRGIQYAAASRFNHRRRGVLDRPVKPGDDSEGVARGLLPARGIAAVLRQAFDVQARLRVLAAQFARALPGHPALKKPRGRREGRVLTSHPRSAARKSSAQEPHSSIQVVPITRPSLRDGWTAYAVLSREPSSFWPPSPSRKSPAPRRLTRMPHPQRA